MYWVSSIFQQVSEFPRCWRLLKNMIPVHLNPLNSVRTTSQFVCENASHVSLSMDAIEEFAESVTTISMEEFRNGVAWDSNDWHYSKDVKECGPWTCQYIFVLDSLNFCFWPNPNMEYDNLSLCLKHVLEKDVTSFSAENLANMTEETLASWFPGLEVPLLSERVLRLQELGEALLEDFDGLAANMVRKANKSTAKLVQLLLRYLPGFRDTAIFKGRLIHFYKRVQILTGDVWAAYGRPTDVNHPYYFEDPEQLTMFPDYRVPQLLRELKIMNYTSELALKIDSKIELPWGCEEEVEIRAYTVVAVMHIRQCLLKRGLNLMDIEIDWLLWQRGEAIKDAIAPHHRTLSIYY